MSRKLTFGIGTRVSYMKKYSRQAGRRFAASKSAVPIPCPHSKPFVGWVVGVRYVIMSESEYHPGGVTTDQVMSYEQAYRTGKLKQMLLVTEDIRKEPYLVRPCDCLFENPVIGDPKEQVRCEVGL